MQMLEELEQNSRIHEKQPISIETCSLLILYNSENKLRSYDFTDTIINQPIRVSALNLLLYKPKLTHKVNHLTFKPQAF